MVQVNNFNNISYILTAVWRFFVFRIINDQLNILPSILHYTFAQTTHHHILFMMHYLIVTFFFKTLFETQNLITEQDYLYCVRNQQRKDRV